MDGAAVVEAARREGADLVIVGPDDPLAAGVVDALKAGGLRAFGPTQRAAQIESSKVWSKDFMRRHGIPTAPHESFDNASAAHRYVLTQPERIVVKADGLARGKGVIVCDTHEEAHQAIDEMMEEHVFGAAGSRVVIEQRIEGDEASVLRCATARRRCRSRRRATTNAPMTATVVRTPAAWAPIARRASSHQMSRKR
jgi:phosphoribosylamine--glycine ligase